MSVNESEPGEPTETTPTSAPPPKTTTALTFDQAIEMGEYHPEVLAQYPHWHTLARHVQFEYITRALAARRKQLLKQWMEINRANDYSLKPHLQKASQNIESQLSLLSKDKEKLYSEYSV